MTERVEELPRQTPRSVVDRSAELGRARREGAGLQTASTSSPSPDGGHPQVPPRVVARRCHMSRELVGDRDGAVSRRPSRREHLTAPERSVLVSVAPAGQPVHVGRRLRGRRDGRGARGQLIRRGSRYELMPRGTRRRSGHCRDRRQTTREPSGSGCAGPAACWDRYAAGHGLPQRVAGRAQLGRQLLVAGPERGDLVLQLEDPAYALDADAAGRERRDLAQQLDVAVAVATAATAGTARHDQAHPLVGAQRLRVQARELGGHADHVDRGVRGQAGRLRPSRLLEEVGAQRACRRRRRGRR